MKVLGVDLYNRHRNGRAAMVCLEFHKQTIRIGDDYMRPPVRMRSTICSTELIYKGYRLP